LSFFNGFVNELAIDEAEQVRLEAEALRVTAESNRASAESARVSGGALIKSGDTMTGDLTMDGKINLDNTDGLVIGNKYKIHYNTISDMIDIVTI